MPDYRLDPLGVKPSDTEGDVMTTVDGVAAWAPSGAAVSQLVPLTTDVAGVPALVWDDDNQLVMTEAV